MEEGKNELSDATLPPFVTTPSDIGDKRLHQDASATMIQRFKKWEGNIGWSFLLLLFCLDAGIRRWLER